jgi:hypothetical protein
LRERQAAQLADQRNRQAEQGQRDDRNRDGQRNDRNRDGQRDDRVVDRNNDGNNDRNNDGNNDRYGNRGNDGAGDRNYDRNRGEDRQSDQRRLSDAQRQALIAAQRSQAERYGRQFQQRQDRARNYADSLHRQNRNSGYRYQQDYYERLRRELARRSWQSHNYNSDPYYYTASNYRYYRGGNYYNTNRYGADLLQQAINYGYQEGIRAGRADHEDGWRPSYRDSFAYMDASFGYNGYYVSQGEYNYYFREGFRRGYEDGYYSRRRYGRYSGGNDAILGNVLSLILNLQPYNRY